VESTVSLNSTFDGLLARAPTKGRRRQNRTSPPGGQWRWMWTLTLVRAPSEAPKRSGTIRKANNGVEPVMRVQEARVESPEKCEFVCPLFLTMPLKGIERARKYHA